MVLCLETSGHSSETVSNAQSKESVTARVYCRPAGDDWEPIEDEGNRTGNGMPVRQNNGLPGGLCSGAKELHIRG
jgi:hypothetical protein